MNLRLECSGIASALPISVLIVSLAGCASGDRGISNPALACQTTKCICVQSDPGIFKKPETSAILWRENGDAYCPEGFDARRANRDDDPFLEAHGG